MTVRPDEVGRLARDNPQAYIKFKLWALEVLGYETHHPEVERFHASSARIKVSCCPARSSKSYSAAHDVLADALIPGTRGWTVGPSYVLAEKEFRYIHERLVIEREKLGLDKPKTCLTNARSGNLLIEFPWGSIVEGKSADSPGSLLGEAIDWALYSEASQLDRKIRERYVRPRLVTKKGRELVPTTPDVKGIWVKDLYDMGLEGHDRIESFNWDITANPLYDLEEFENAKRDYGEASPVFREQYLGEWVYYGGTVYDFDPNVHVIPPFDIPPSWPRVRAIDPGHRDPFAVLWMAVGPQNELYLYQEYYSIEGLPISVHADKIKAMSTMGDVSPRMRTIVDRSATQVMEDLAYEGIGGEASNSDRLAGRMRVQEYLLQSYEGVRPHNREGNDGFKWPKLYVFNTLTNFASEIQHYRWKEARQIESEKERTEGADHLMDLLRYLVMTRPAARPRKKLVHPESFNAIRDRIKRRERVAGYRRMY